MSKILIYGFEGTFVGKNEYEYGYPNLNDSHKCMLFMHQESEESDIELASKECKKYGFEVLSIKVGSPIHVEVLNSEKFKGFKGFYEEALEERSSLVYYPNT
jgi:hypothetical protein